MARLRQSGGASGVRKVPQSLWERAGERAGNGAGALFARLDAQDAQDAQDALDALEQTAVAADQTRDQTRAQAALTLERLAAQIRAGAWSAEIAALVTAAHNALATLATDEG
jgi:DNA-binding GntR family transcriptional regulator